MADNLKPGLGTVFAASAATPATEDVAGYAALTYTDVGEITEIPESGESFEVVTHVPLATGLTAKYHGANNAGSLTIPMALDNADAGQAILKAALASKSRISFSETYPDGEIRYYQGKVFSFTVGAATGSVVTANVMIERETADVWDS